MSKSIYDLNLHESTDVESISKGATTYWQVMRTADGWIYTRWDSQKQDYVGHGIAVKFNNQFQEKSPSFI